MKQLNYKLSLDWQLELGEGKVDQSQTNTGQIFFNILIGFGQGGGSGLIVSGSGSKPLLTVILMEKYLYRQPRKKTLK